MTNPNTAGKVTRPQQQQPRDSSPASIQARIDQLETLVASLTQKTQATQHDSHVGTAAGPSDINHTPENSTASLSGDFGRITLTDTKSSYVGSSHWSAIIDKVRVLRQSSCSVLPANGEVRSLNTTTGSQMMTQAPQTMMTPMTS